MGGNNINKRGFDQLNEVNEKWDNSKVNSSSNNLIGSNGDSPILISQSSVSNERIPVETISSSNNSSNSIIHSGSHILNGATIVATSSLSNNSTPTTSLNSNSSFNNSSSSSSSSSTNGSGNGNASSISETIMNFMINNANNYKDIDIINSSSTNLNSTSPNNNFSIIHMNNSGQLKTRVKGERKRTKFPDEEVKVLCDLVVLFGKDVRTILTFKPFSDGKYSERQIYDKVRALKKGGLVPSHPDSDTIRKAKIELGIGENVDTDTLRSGKKGRLSNVVTTQHSDSEYSSSEHEDDEAVSGSVSANTSTTNLIGSNNNSSSSNNSNNISSSNLINLSSSSSPSANANSNNNNSSSTNLSSNISNATPSPQSPNSTNTSTTNLTKDSPTTSSTSSTPISSPTTTLRRASMRLTNRRNNITQENTQLNQRLQQIFNLSSGNLNGNNSSTNLNILSPGTTTSSTILSNRLRERDKEKSNSSLERAKIEKISDKGIDQHQQHQKRIQTREKPTKIHKKETYIDSDIEFEEEEEEEEEPPIIGKENSFLQLDYYSTNHNYSLKNNKTFQHNSNSSSNSNNSNNNKNSSNSNNNNSNNNNSNNSTSSNINISSNNLTGTSSSSSSSSTTTTQPISISGRINSLNNKLNPFLSTSTSSIFNSNGGIGSGIGNYSTSSGNDGISFSTTYNNINHSSLNRYASSVLNGGCVVFPNTNSFFRYETEKNLLIFYPYFTKSPPVNSYTYDKDILVLTIEMPNVFDWLVNTENSKPPISSGTKITVEFPHPGKNYGPPRKINKLPDEVNGIAFIFEKIKQGNVDLDLSSL